MKRLAVLALLTVPALAACSPVAEPLVAVGRNAAGQPVALAHFCATGHREELSLYAIPGPYGSQPPPGDIWRIAADPDLDAGLDWTVEFGTTPPGWSAELAGPVTLDPDARYLLDGHSSKLIGAVEFRVADLDKLGPDQVLTNRRGKSGGPVTMPRTQFLRQAKDAC